MNRRPCTPTVIGADGSGYNVDRQLPRQRFPQYARRRLQLPLRRRRRPLGQPDDRPGRLPRLSTYAGGEAIAASGRLLTGGHADSWGEGSLLALALRWRQAAAINRLMRGGGSRIGEDARRPQPGGAGAGSPRAEFARAGGAAGGPGFGAVRCGRPTPCCARRRLLPSGKSAPTPATPSLSRLSP